LSRFSPTDWRLKIRGTASPIAEKYLQLARDAGLQSLAAENYYQHAEHYSVDRAAPRNSFGQNSPITQGGDQRGMCPTKDTTATTSLPSAATVRAARAATVYPREQHQPQAQGHSQPRPQQVDDEDAERLPSFITGGQPQPQPQQAQGGNGPHGPNGQSGPNGQNGYDGSPDRFPLHRRRRRHRGPRDHTAQGSDNDAPSGARSDD
jgi:hypothetical protein